MIKATTIYIGLRERMIAEVGALDLCACGYSKRETKYMIMLAGNAQFDPIAFGNRREAKEEARTLADFYGCEICWV